MTRILSTVLACAALVVSLWLTGCGGGGSGGSTAGSTRQGSGTITSSDSQLIGGSHADTMHFTIKKTGRYAVEMTSSDVDSYIVVWAGDASDFTESTWIGSDDDSGSGLDARVTFDARAGATYSVRFTTHGADDFGSYDWMISETSSRVAEPEDGSASGKPLVALEQLHIAK